MSENEIVYERQKVILSTQALILIDSFDKVKKDSFLKWYFNERGVIISGGDIVDYLKYMKDNGE